MMDEDFRFDVRIRERMLARGAVSEDELKTRIEALADIADQAELIDLDPPVAQPTESGDEEEAAAPAAAPAGVPGV